MNLIVVTPVRLLGDGLAACLATREGVCLRATVPDLSRLREALLAKKGVDIVLVDVTLHIDLEDMRVLAFEQPSVTFVALGLLEQRQDVIRCGRAGFSSFVSRTASIDQLYQALTDVMAGRLACSAEISCDLLRALFRNGCNAPEVAAAQALTRREGEVLQLIGRGLSNKEIARELQLSLATVKHHVHNVLEKLEVSGRAQAMRRVRDAPWIASSPMGSANEAGNTEGLGFPRPLAM